MSRPSRRGALTKRSNANLRQRVVDEEIFKHFLIDCHLKFGTNQCPDQCHDSEALQKRYNSVIIFKSCGLDDKVDSTRCPSQAIQVALKLCAWSGVRGDSARVRDTAAKLAKQARVG
eukprot:6193009-Pleurochrysis_carterae.AAC.1